MTVDKSWCHGLTAAATSLTPDLSRTRRSGRPDFATEFTCPQSLLTRTKLYSSLLQVSGTAPKVNLDV